MPSEGGKEKRVTLCEAMTACRQEAKTECPAACFSSFRNRYLFANIVYFIYATGILYIDLVGELLGARVRGRRYSTRDVARLADS